MRVTVRLDRTKVWALRQARGWTQDELAEKSGLSQSWLHRAERQDRPYEADKVAKLAEAYGVELAALGVSDQDAEVVKRAEAAIKEAKRILRLARRHKRLPQDGTVKSASEYPDIPTHSWHAGYLKHTEYAAARAP